MKKILYLLLAIVFFPISSHALTVETVNESFSHTGGISAESGTVIATGSSSASSEIETTVTGGAEGSTIEIKIETEADGVKHTESVKKKVPAGSNVTVTVGTTSEIGAEVVGEVRITEDSAPRNSPSTFTRVRSFVANLFKSIVSVFKWPW